jgi:hypothetical protein
MRDKEIRLTLTISSAMHDRLQEIGKKAGHQDVNDFLLFILRELFPLNLEEMDRKEQEIIEQRLRDLGYL